MPHGWVSLAGAGLLVMLVSADAPVRAQDANGAPSFQALTQGEIAATPGGGSSDIGPTQIVARFETDIQTVITANTDPQDLAAEIADFVATTCLGGGDCAALTRATLNLARALPSPGGIASPIAGAIGSALAQVANSTRQVAPEVERAITSEIAATPLARCTSCANIANTIASFNAVAALTAADTATTATIGTAASGG